MSNLKTMEDLPWPDVEAMADWLRRQRLPLDAGVELWLPLPEPPEPTVQPESPRTIEIELR